MSERPIGTPAPARIKGTRHGLSLTRPGDLWPRIRLGRWLRCHAAGVVRATMVSAFVELNRCSAGSVHPVRLNAAVAWPVRPNLRWSRFGYARRLHASQLRAAQLRARLPTMPTCILTRVDTWMPKPVCIIISIGSITLPHPCSARPVGPAVKQTRVTVTCHEHSPRLTRSRQARTSPSPHPPLLSAIRPLLSAVSGRSLRPWLSTDALEACWLGRRR